MCLLLTYSGVCSDTHPSMASSIFFFLSSMSSGVSMPAGTEEKPPGVINPLSKQRENRHLWALASQTNQRTEPERNSTCLRVWRSPFHLVSPPRSPPPPLPQMTLHQTPPARPTWLDPLPPPPLWPVNIIRQSQTAAGMTSVWRRNINIYN